MTAAEVIEMINSLAPEEQAKVIDFLEKLDVSRTPVAGADEKSFAAAAQWAFNEHAELMRKLSR